jgi:hypothetical protein
MGLRIFDRAWAQDTPELDASFSSSTTRVRTAVLRRA